MKSEMNIPDPDAFYEALVQANEGLSEVESASLMNRLCLLLANQIGDQAVLMQAVAASRAKTDPLMAAEPRTARDPIT